MARTRKKSLAGLDKKLGTVLSHRLRVEALIIFGDRTASPNEIAKELGVTVQQLSHHVRVLRDLELIELVGEEKRRGAVEHYYRATHRDVVSNEEAAKLSLDERRIHSAAAYQRQMLDAALALESGTMDSRADRHLTRIPMHLDEQGAQELLAAHNELFQRSVEIQEESAERLASDGDHAAEAVHFSSQQGCFEVPAPRRSEL